FSSAPANENSPFAIFYTSGSSQRPRPLVYTHGGTWHNVTNHSRSLQITAADRITLLSPCSAAASVSAIFGALLNGASPFLFHPRRQTKIVRSLFFIHPARLNGPGRLSTPTAALGTT